MAFNIFQEVRVDVLDQFGTVDWLAIDGSVAHMADAKFGRIAVDSADKNAQLQAYSLGVWDKFPEVESITVHILMPRLGTISRHTYTRKADYERIKMRIMAIIARAKNPGDHNPSLAACEWCGKKATCPALAEKALLVVQRTGDLLDVPEHTGALTIKEPADMNKLMKIAPILEKWAKDIKDEALRLHLEEGWEYEDFALAERSTPRAVTSVPLAYEALKGEVSVQEFLNCCKGVSIPELENVFAAKAPRGKKAVEKERLEVLLQDAMVLKEESTLRYLKIRKAPKKAEKKTKTIETV